MRKSACFTSKQIVTVGGYKLTCLHLNQIITVWGYQLTRFTLSQVLPSGGIHLEGVKIGGMSQTVYPAKAPG
jgi:hypothetical protein